MQKLYSGECAVLTFYSPYVGLGEAFRRLFTWLPTSGRAPRNGPPFEVYVGDPRGTPPEKLRTDIHILLEAR